MRLLPLCLLLCLLPACNRHQSTLPEPSIAIDTSLLQEGDLIFRKGRGLESQVVVAADKGASYSHVGLLIHMDNRWWVLHAVPGEEAESNGKQVVKKDTLALFIQSDRCIQACILRYDTSIQALETVKKEGLRLFEKEMPFDHSYSISDTTKMYCTEFVCYLYRFIGVDLSEGRCHRFPMLKEPIVYPIDLTMNTKLHPIWNSLKSADIQP